MREELNGHPLGQFRAAVENGEAGQVRPLLEQHPELRVKINAPIFSFDAPAIVAAKEKRELVEVLLDYGAGINARSNWWAICCAFLRDGPSPTPSTTSARSAGRIRTDAGRVHQQTMPSWPSALDIRITTGENEYTKYALRTCQPRRRIHQHAHALRHAQSHP